MRLSDTVLNQKMMNVRNRFDNKRCADSFTVAFCIYYMNTLDIIKKQKHDMQALIQTNVLLLNISHVNVFCSQALILFFSQIGGKQNLTLFLASAVDFISVINQQEGG